MLLIIAAWIYWFIVCVLIGSGTLKLITKSATTALGYDIFYQFWFGFGILVALLELLSLFLPTNHVVFIIILLLAVVFAITRVRRAVIERKTRPRLVLTLNGTLSFLGIASILLLVAYCANKEVTHPDTLIYHYNAVKWAKEFPAVPGLVNLHGRLAFNSSFFLFAAVTDIGPYADHSAHIALSLLMAVCIVHWISIIANRKEIFIKRVFCMMTLPYLLYHTSIKIDIASLSTDYPMAIALLVFCLILLDKLKYKPLLLLPVSAIVFTIKFSGMLAVGAGVLVVIVYLLQLKYQKPDPLLLRKARRVCYISLGLTSLIILGFIARNIILSGWVLYPFPVGNLHLSWSTPKPYVDDMIAVIKSYPKIPGGASTETINGHDFFYWFNQWYDRFKVSDEFYLLVVALATLTWCIVDVRSRRAFVYANLKVPVLVLFTLASIVFWFTSAPDVRFGSVYFYILFASSIVLLAGGKEHQPIFRTLIYLIFIHRTAQQLPAFVFDREPFLFTLPFTGQPNLVKVVGSPEGENPPLTIYMPAQGNKCGNSPLPCTPYAGGLLHQHQKIRQRKPGDLSKGFLPPLQ